MSDRYQRHWGKMLLPVSFTGVKDTGDKLFAGFNNIADKVFHRRKTVVMTEVCSCCKTIFGRRSRPRPPILSLEGPGGRQSYFKPKRHYLVLGLWRPQGPLIKICGVFLDATFHGGSNDTIGRWPSSVAGDFADLSPSTFSYPWQLPTSMAPLFL